MLLPLFACTKFMSYGMESHWTTQDACMIAAGHVKVNNKVHSQYGNQNLCLITFNTGL